MKQISEFIVVLFSNTSPFYIVTLPADDGLHYFYTAFRSPDETAEQLRKNGGSSGIRPGRPTQDYSPGS